MAFVDFAALCAKNRRKKERKTKKNKAIAILPFSETFAEAVITANNEVC
jgi:hypothetical protein